MLACGHAHLLLGCGGDYSCAGEVSTVGSKVLTFSSRFEGRERVETSQDMNKWRRSSVEEVTIRASRDGQRVHYGHPACEVAPGNSSHHT